MGNARRVPCQAAVIGGRLGQCVNATFRARHHVNIAVPLLDGHALVERRGDLLRAVMPRPGCAPVVRNAVAVAVGVLIVVEGDVAAAPEHERLAAQKAVVQPARRGKDQLVRVGIVAHHGPLAVNVIHAERIAVHNVGRVVLNRLARALLDPEHPQPPLGIDPELNVEAVNELVPVAGDDDHRLRPCLPLIVAYNHQIEIVDMRLAAAAGIPAREQPPAARGRDGRAALILANGFVAIFLLRGIKEHLAGFEHRNVHIDVLLL